MAAKPDKQIQELMKKLEKARDGMLKDIKSIGDFAANLIKKRTRLGYSVPSHGGSKSKLKPLSPKYIKQRGRENLSPMTTKNRSNLTRTGEMLDSIISKKTSENTIEIGFSNEDSENKAEWNAKDRPFNFLSSAEQKQIKQELGNILQKILAKIK